MGALREYEFTFVIQPEITEDGIRAICERFEGILAKSGGEKLFYEDWGRRRLAYDIRHFQKGHYQVLHFLSNGAVIPELERSARLDDSILRFLTVLANDAVTDVEARKAEGVALEEDRMKRAAEKAARDAEEAAREAEEAARRSEEGLEAEDVSGDAGDEPGDPDSDEDSLDDEDRP